MTPDRINLHNVGPIKQADIRFGDLTVVVGPQATGKSIFLQLLKLVVDAPAVRQELKKYNNEWQGSPSAFFDLYFGEGMSSLWTEESRLKIDGQARNLADYSRGTGQRLRPERLFFIPAQRVMSLRDGLTRPFTEYRYGDPFALKEFSEKLHQLVQNEFGRDPSLFPRKNRLSEALRLPIAQHIFGSYTLGTDSERSQRRIVLQGPEGSPGLPYLVWSAGQREFVPLLLGFYWLCPAAKITRRGSLDWAVIEELEMGLHPQAISVVLALVLELLSRGYRVCLSTHSPHVLDVVWALRFLQQHGGRPADVLDVLSLPKQPSTKKLAAAALAKEFRVYYFKRDGKVLDISSLDPGADDAAEAGWGGLTEFSGRVGDIVARVARRHSVAETSQ